MPPRLMLRRGPLDTRGDGILARVASVDTRLQPAPGVRDLPACDGEAGCLHGASNGVCCYGFGCAGAAEKQRES